MTLCRWIGKQRAFSYVRARKRLYRKHRLLLRREVGVALAAGALLFGADYTRDTEAQEHYLSLAESPVCGRCHLEIERVATISDWEGDAGLKPPAPQDVVRTTAGHFIVITTNPNVPLHFDSDGHFLGTLGQQGQGPGDYRSPMSAVEDHEDSIWIFDIGLRRRTAWTPRGDYLRSYPLPGRVRNAVVLDDDTLIVSGTVRTPANIGFPLHRMSLDGEILDSFGPEVNVDATGRNRRVMRRRLARSIDAESFWAFSYDEYKMEKYTSGGRLVTAIDRDVEWFPKRDSTVATSLAMDGPQPRIRGLVEDERGRLHVLLSLPDANWKLGLGERQLQPGFEHLGVYWTPVLDYRRVWDFAIEVIDVKNGDVLLSERFDAASVAGWIDDRHLATFQTVDVDESDLDVPIINIFRVEFRDER